MAAPRFAWGIDIGNRALKAVKLVSSADGLVIDDFDVVEHDTVLSASGDNRDSLVQTALATFVGRHPGIEKGQVGVSVNGQRTFAKFIKLPPVEKSKIPEIVKFEAIQQIPFPLDDVEWSYHLFQDPESPDVEVGIFAMRKELVNAHIAFFTDAKLNVQAVQMSPLSVYNAMYYDSRIKGTTMVVDLGAESTDLIIAEGEGVWLRSIPIGGNNFTEALTKSFRVDFDKAEELKRNATTSKYSRQIVQAMRPIFADLVSEIQRSMGFYTSTHKESRIERVIALGNTFRLPGLQRYLQQNLTLEVSKLDRLGTSTIEDPRLAGMLNENLLSSAGAYGLALQVMGQGKIASSLLPEHIRREKMWREKNKWFAAAAALFVAGAGVAFGSYYFSNAALTDTENVALQEKIDDAKRTSTKLAGEWDAIQVAGAGDLQRVRNVEALARNHGLWPQINTLLHQSLPQFAPSAPKGVGEGVVEALKKVPRGDREQIVLSAYTSKYYPDLTTVLAGNLPSFADGSIESGPGQLGGLESGMGAANNALAGTAVGTPKRGYVLTLLCSTPNKAGPAMFVRYIADLTGSPPTATRPWKVTEATVVRQMPLAADANRMTSLRTAWTAAQKLKQPPPDAVVPGAAGTTPGAMPAMPVMPPGPAGGDPQDPAAVLGGGTGAGAGGVPDEAYQDPVLGEDVRNDTVAIIVLVIELDVAPPAPPAGAPATPMTPPKSVADAR